jgi:hypothetical protein
MMILLIDADSIGPDNARPVVSTYGIQRFPQIATKVKSPTIGELYLINGLGRTPHIAQSVETCIFPKRGME